MLNEAKSESLAKIGTFDEGRFAFPEIEINEGAFFLKKTHRGPQEIRPLGGHNSTKERELITKPIDLRDFYYFSPIDNQGKTKTCSAFALADLIEFYEHDLNGTNNQLAVGWMHKCIGKQDLSQAIAFEQLCFALRGHSIPVITSEYPWSSTECNRNGVIEMFSLESKGSGNYSSNFILKVLHSRRPIVTSLLVNRDFEKWSSFEPYNFDPSKEAYEHAVVVIGYDDDHWICRNSMGDNWGKDGYFRVAFGDCELCTGTTRVFTFKQAIPQKLS